MRAAVLNPWFAGDLRYPVVAESPLLLARGRYAVAGAQAPITRWLPAALAAVASDCFELDAIFCPAARATERPMVWRCGVTDRRLPRVESFHFHAVPTPDADQMKLASLPRPFVRLRYGRRSASKIRSSWCVLY